MRFSAPKKGLEIENLPSRLAAIARTCAAVTAPCPPKPDIRMLSRFLIMIASSGLRLTRQLLGRRFPLFVLCGEFGQQLFRRLTDVLLVREPLGRLLRIPHFLEAFHAVLSDFED